MNFVDLRSDTVTKPSAGMRDAMVNAPVGDDVYGEDPTVNRLEAYVAELLGHEAALFTPTGSMANQLGIRLLVKPGEELLCDIDAHVVRAELGAAAAFSGITTRTWSTPRSILDADTVIAMMRPASGPYLVSTTAVAVENTHNFGGGTVQPLDQIQNLRAATQSAGVTMHLDGARLWNAHIASGVSLSEYARYFDTVSVCLSKGLGAPVGSLLVSDAARINEARQWRKRYGGGMRQVGILAAAGLFALQNNINRLADDHRRAKQLADACHQAAPSTIDPTTVETNIVGLDLKGMTKDAATIARECKEEGVVVSALGPKYVRLVTHLDLTDSDIEQACDVLARCLKH